MKYIDSVVAWHLDTASAKRRWMSFLQHSATLATVVTALMLLGGVAMVRGWVTSSLIVGAVLALVIVAGTFAWAIVAVVVATTPARTNSLAAALERAHRPLLDRLNTLIFLREKDEPALRAYAECIEAQTRQVLEQTPPPFPFTWHRALAHVGLAVLVILLTGWFYGAYHPWQQLRAHQAAAATTVADPETLQTIPPDNLAEKKAVGPEAPWGEVRISEPGRDLRATKLDIVPLEIEAAASRPITAVQWYSAVNGGTELRHTLPAPEDPRYAVYRPEIVLEDFPVELWDVVSYYATATCEDGQAYRSEMYFIGIYPFPEELEQVPGGRDGPSFELLERLTGMIEHQQEVMRQTDWETRLPDTQGAESKQRRQRLGAEEKMLAEASRYLPAAADAEFGPAALENLGEHFQRAEDALREAETTLRDGPPAAALEKEKSGLAELVATRKRFHELLAQHPQAFERPAGDPPLAQAQHAEDLGRMQQRLEQFQSVRKQLQSALMEQRNIERSVNPNNKQNLPRLAERQRKLSESLDQLIQQNSQCFGNCQKQCAGAQSASRGAAEAIRAGSSDARQRAAEAGDQLQQLDNALEEQMARQRLADAHRLKQMLDDQVSQLAQLGQASRPAGSQPQPSDSPGKQSGGKPSDGQPAGTPSAGSSPGGQKPGQQPAGTNAPPDPRQLAEQVRQATDQLKQIADEPPTDTMFGPALGKSLAEEKKRQIDDGAQRLSSADQGGDRSAAARELQQRLQEVGRAFDSSRPGTRSGRPPGQPLEETGQQAISQGLRQLESAARRRELGRGTPPTDLRLRRSAARSLQDGLWGQYGHNERTDSVVNRLTDKLEEPDFAVDGQTVRQLLRQIQSLRREVATAQERKPDESDIQHLDASRYPPAYRRSIEKYFQKLSEQP